jgi:ribosomal protein S18 acetylase RimI-like enzyme
VTDQFVIEPLTSRHDRTSFTCNVPALDRYLREFAMQDVRRRVANCYVAVGTDDQLTRGFFTLAATGLHLKDIPADVAKGLPRYPVVPAVLIGRLAVDRRYCGRGLGAALLGDAFMRAARSEPAVHTMLVDAKDEQAAAFYRHYGFRPLASNPMSLFLPLASAHGLEPRPA